MTTGTVVKVRRLSTVSSVAAAAGHVFSTRWEWYWKDENNKWQSYDTPGDGHAVNTTSSQCLEREYLAGKVEVNDYMLYGSGRKYTLFTAIDAIAMMAVVFLFNSVKHIDLDLNCGSPFCPHTCIWLRRDFLVSLVTM